MSQAGYTPLSLYYSTTAAAVPTAGNLANGELAINITDGKLYYKNNSGVVTLLAGSTGSGPAGGSNTQVQYNASGLLAGNAGLTWDGSFLTASSIKDTALSSGQIVYTGGSGLLVTSNNLTYSGTDLANSNGDIIIGNNPSVTTRMFRAIEVGTVGNNAGIAFGNAGGKGAIYGYSGGSGINIVSGNSGPIAFGYATGGADATANFLSLGAWTTTGLGIGTASPAYTLDVVGRARIGIAGSVPALTLVSGTNGSADVFVSNNTTGLRLVGGTVIGTDSQILLGGSASGTSTNIYFDGAVKTFRNTSGSSDQMVITSAGLVGIGTSSPSRLLTVQATGTGNVANFQSNAGPNIAFTGTETSGRTYLIGEGLVTAGNFSIYDSTGSAERFVVNSSGNVGIGTTTPAAKLQVNAATDTIKTLGTSYNQQLYDCSAGFSQAVWFYIGTARALIGANSTGMFVNTAGDSTAPIVFGTGSSSNERMRLDSSGNLGIGTTSPTGRLDVVYDNALVGRFYSSAGRGIVRVDGLTDSSFQSYKNGSLVGFFQSDGGGTEIVTGTSGAFPYSIYTNNTEKVRVTSAGEVGIGTTSAYNSSKLSVAGDAEMRGNMRSYFSSRGGLAIGASVNLFTVPNGSYGTAVSMIVYVQQSNDNSGSLTNYQFSITGWAGSNANVTTSSAQAYGSGSSLSVSTTGSSGGLIVTLTNSSGAASTTMNMSAIVLAGYEALTWGW